MHGSLQTGRTKEKGEGGRRQGGEGTAALETMGGKRGASAVGGPDSLAPPRDKGDAAGSAGDATAGISLRR